MKKTINIVGGILLCLFSISINAQETWEAKKNPTVDSIVSQYEGKYIAPRKPLTTADIFPVIGNYESATNPEAAAISISLDEENKGLVWIEGIPQGKIKAMLRKSPAVYKIPAQKTEEGKAVPEGTLIFDNETNTLSICIGKMFNAEDPESAFRSLVEETATTTKSSKTKKTTPSKTWTYTGTKLAIETVAN